MERTVYGCNLFGCKQSRIWACEGMSVRVMFLAGVLAKVPRARLAAIFTIRPQLNLLQPLWHFHLTEQSCAFLNKSFVACSLGFVVYAVHCLGEAALHGGTYIFGRTPTPL